MNSTQHKIHSRARGKNTLGGAPLTIAFHCKMLAAIRAIAKNHGANHTIATSYQG